MKTKNLITNIGKLGLVGLTLVGLTIGCGKREDRVVLKEKLNENYTIKYIHEDWKYMQDGYKLVIEDSTGNEIVKLHIYNEAPEVTIKRKDSSIIHSTPGKGVYFEKK